MNLRGSLTNLLAKMEVNGLNLGVVFIYDGKLYVELSVGCVLKVEWRNTYK